MARAALTSSAPRVRGRRVGVVLTMLALGTSACAHAKKNDDQPVIHIDKTWNTAEPIGCDYKQSDIVVRQGRVPPAAEKIVDLDLRADRPTPLALFESILAQWGVRHCVPAVALLRAELADGASGVTRVVAVGYRIPSADTATATQAP